MADDDLRAFADVRLALVERFHADGSYYLAPRFIEQTIARYDELGHQHAIAVALILPGVRATRLGRAGESVRP